MSFETPPFSPTLSSSSTTPQHKVFVGGISWKADEPGLTKYFGSFGTVLDCKIIMDKTTQKSKGYGFVTFVEEESALKVKNSTQLHYMGKNMNVGDAVRKADLINGGGIAQQNNENHSAHSSPNGRRHSGGYNGAGGVGSPKYVNGELMYYEPMVPNTNAIVNNNRTTSNVAVVPTDNHATSNTAAAPTTTTPNNNHHTGSSYKPHKSNNHHHHHNNNVQNGSTNHHNQHSSTPRDVPQASNNAYIRANPIYFNPNSPQQLHQPPQQYEYTEDEEDGYQYVISPNQYYTYVPYDQYSQQQQQQQQYQGGYPYHQYTQHYVNGGYVYQQPWYPPYQSAGYQQPWPTSTSPIPSPSSPLVATNANNSNNATTTKTKD